MKRIARLCLIALLALSLFSCGLNNTMYNARKYFKMAQARGVNAQGKPSAQAVNEYTKTIQKCGIILTEDSKGPKAAEAVYLMARALYYKKNAAFQAKDAFESLIKGYPDSKYIPDAHLYLARVLREVNQIEASENVLEQFVRDNNFRKHHAKALLLLTEFEIADKDYDRAQYWLKRIITDYKDSKEYKEASFLYGKNYADQGEYELSLQEFNKFIKSRGITKEKKLEAQYYIAFNRHMLGDSEYALKATKSLLRNEWRAEMLSRAKLLNSQALIATGKIDAGLKGYEDTTKSYARTEPSAQAYYDWANYLYYEQGNRDSAIQYFNRVRVEAPTLEIATIGQRKATAIGHTKISANIDPNKNLQEYLNAHYQRAESFFSPLELPDSSLAVYWGVIAQKDSFAVQLDTLSVYVLAMQAEIDSISVIAAELDSLLMAVAQEESEDDIELTETEGIDLESLAEDMPPEDIAALEVPNEPSEEDAIKEPEISDTERLSQLNTRLTQLRDERDLTAIKIQNLETALERFDNDILPFCYYSIFHLFYQDESKTAEAEEVFQHMQEHYPRNLYFAAAEAIKAGKTPSLVDPDYEDARTLFDLALDYYPEQPDSLIAVMQDFTQSTYQDLRDNAYYRLGWYYTFDEPDTTQAFFHLNFILEEADNPSLATEVRKFYNGKKFLYRDEETIDTLYHFEPLPIIPAGMEVPGRKPVEDEEKAEETASEEESGAPLSDDPDEPDQELDLDAADVQTSERDTAESEPENSAPEPDEPATNDVPTAETEQNNSAHPEDAPADLEAPSDEIKP